MRGSTSFASASVSEIPANQLETVVNQAHAMGMQLSKDDSGANSITSPLSLLLALSMLGEGATGEAADQLDAAWGARGDERSHITAALITSLAPFDEGFKNFDAEGSPPEEPLLHIANRVVADDEFEPYPEFLDRLSSYHDAPLGRTDLAGEGAKDYLSAWVKENTAGLIPSSAMTPHDRLRLVLQNAVLFAASWKQPFAEESEFDEDFYLADGTVIRAPAIHATRTVPYARLGSWQAIQFDYTDGFTAEIVLPPKGTDPSSLPADQLTELLNNLRGGGHELHIFFPTLDIKTTNDLLDDIEDLGMGALLNPDANPLARIGESEYPLYVGQATQQATLRVDVEGTVAAAVTEVGIMESTAIAEPPPQNFFVDHPYLFLVHHEETGMPVFLAAIRNPGGQ